MILKIAWRNIWRNKVRSLVVIFANIIGVISIIFLLAMVYGITDSYIQNAIQKETSHIQIHDKQFPTEKEIRYFIPESESFLKNIDSISSVKNSSIRSVVSAMVSSGRVTKGLRVFGVHPDREKGVTGISNSITKGGYLSDDSKKQIIISEILAEKLKVKLRSKLVLTFQNIDNEIVSNAFRVNGIFRSGNALYDENTAFINISAMNELLGKDGIGHEAIIYLKEINQLDTTIIQLKSQFPELLVQSYKEIAPELDLFASQIGMVSIIYISIFMLALIFGIINTMLMAVLERVRELGMLMAIGMNKFKVFIMIVVETIMLGMLGTPIGLFISFLIVEYYGKHGLNLFFYSQKSMEQFGMSSYVYLKLNNNDYLILAISVFITSLLASIYPAIKAIRLKPTEAIRKL
jgi:ABC-type lipoprotein release transport system permease subunit